MEVPAHPNFPWAAPLRAVRGLAPRVWTFQAVLQRSVCSLSPKPRLSKELWYGLPQVASPFVGSFQRKACADAACGLVSIRAKHSRVLCVLVLVWKRSGNTGWSHPLGLQDYLLYEKRSGRRKAKIKPRVNLLRYEASIDYGQTSF